jgi:23S rRNA pseudouridine2605 synthase
LARAINKSGHASRSQAEKMVLDGRVRLNGRIVRDPEAPTTPKDRIEIEGAPLADQAKVYLLCNKPRGLVTTASDEKGRETVFKCLEGRGLPHVGPVGRLDMASEGLLLFTNDTEWSDALLDPANGVPKTYHVQVAGIPTDSDLQRMRDGIDDRGERLAAKAVALLRSGDKNCWLEFVLLEGKNREIRRVLAAAGHEVLRLVRVAVGPVGLGNLPKGDVRPLEPSELAALDALARRDRR